MLQAVRRVVAPLVPGRWKVRPPCPPSLLASTEDRVMVVGTGAAALVTLVLGGAESLSFERALGPSLSSVYLAILVAYGVGALVAGCVLTLGIVMRAWAVTVTIFATMALYVVHEQALLTVGFYLWGAWGIGTRGDALVKAGRLVNRARA